MSSGTGTPSFGDLFDDPDEPSGTAAVVAPPSRPEARPAPTRAPVVVEADEPVHIPADEPVHVPAAEPVQVPAAEVADVEAAQAPEAPAAAAVDTTTTDDARTDDDAGFRAEHDLDHESEEASHLVAGFEADEDDEPAAPVRPGSVSVAAAGAAAAARSAAARDAAPAAWDGEPDPARAAAPAARVDTGRLYRSSGAEGPATLDAIPAIDPSRTPMPATPVAAPRPAAAPRSGPRMGAGLTYSGVVVIVTGVTVIAAFIEALLRHEIGWLTGLALLVSSVYSALVVRRPDIWAAVVVPPIAFLVASLTAGQLTLDPTGSLLIREGYGLFRNLAVNAPWILGTTAICLVIVLVRRTRDRAAA